MELSQASLATLQASSEWQGRKASSYPWIHSRQIPGSFENVPLAELASLLIPMETFGSAPARS